MDALGGNGAGSVAAARPAPRSAPVDRLCLTVGGSPVPVLLTLLGLRPRGVVAVVTAQSAEVWRRVAALYARLAGSQLTEHVVQVPAHDPARTGAAIREALPDPGWSLGYSGGSPTMAATAFQVWHAAHGAAPLPDVSSDPAAWYVAESGDALLRHDGVYVESATVLAGSNVSLVELMRLHGAEPLGDLQRWQPHVPARDVDAVLNGLVRLPRRIPLDHRSEAQRACTDLLLDGLAHLADTGGTSVHVLGSFDIARRGQRVTAAASTDAALVHGLGISIVRLAVYPRAQHTREAAGAHRDLTFRWRPAWVKDELFDVERVAQAVGGLQARGAVLCMSARNTYGVEPVKVAAVDVGPDYRPSRLGPGRHTMDAAVEPLPAISGFSVDDLQAALYAVRLGVGMDLSGELTRWIAWETEQ